MTVTKESEETRDLKNAVVEFTDRVTGLRLAIVATMYGLKIYSEKIANDIDAIIKDNEHKTEGDTTRTDNAFKLKTVTREASRIQKAIEITPNGQLVNLISQFDAFLTQILRCYFNKHKNSILKESKSIPLNELCNFGSIDDAIAYIVEKEIADVMRESHDKQVEYFEKFTKTSLRKGASTWAQFVEITERRNLFTHCDGKVSRQYINNCEYHKVNSQCPPKLNEKLNVSAKYYYEASAIVFETGIRLSQVFWRKVYKDDKHGADKCLIDVLYELLEKGLYNEIKLLTKYCTDEIAEYYNDESRLMILINCAAAYKFSKDKKGCQDLLAKVDWSGRSDVFKIAVAALSDDKQEVIRLMTKIGSSGEVTKDEYAEWPLFSEVRKTKWFRNLYSSIFNATINVPPATQLVKKDKPTAIGHRSRRSAGRSKTE